MMKESPTSHLFDVGRLEASRPEAVISEREAADEREAKAFADSMLELGRNSYFQVEIRQYLEREIGRLIDDADEASPRLFGELKFARSLKQKIDADMAQAKEIVDGTVG